MNLHDSIVWKPWGHLLNSPNFNTFAYCVTIYLGKYPLLKIYPDTWMYLVINLINNKMRRDVCNYHIFHIMCDYNPNVLYLRFHKATMTEYKSVPGPCPVCLCVILLNSCPHNQGHAHSSHTTFVVTLKSMVHLVVIARFLGLLVPIPGLSQTHQQSHSMAMQPWLLI